MSKSKNMIESFQYDLQNLTNLYPLETHFALTVNKVRIKNLFLTYRIAPVELPSSEQHRLEVSISSGVSSHYPTFRVKLLGRYLEQVSSVSTAFTAILEQLSDTYSDSKRLITSIRCGVFEESKYTVDRIVIDGTVVGRVRFSHERKGEGRYFKLDWRTVDLEEFEITLADHEDWGEVYDAESVVKLLNYDERKEDLIGRIAKYADKTKEIMDRLLRCDQIPPAKKRQVVL